ncbi:MAG: RluA family pseudouridine synthase [Limnohabitans sp.]
MTGLHVWFADAHLVVVDKPANLLSVPGRGPDKLDCVLHRLHHTHPGALVVHRLDMATSGLMVFALHADSQRALSQMFAARQVQKKYLAWVHGKLPIQAAWQTIDLPLMADWPNRPLQKVDPQGKPSVTQWRCTQHHDRNDASLLQLKPLTGRSHQLRVHLQAIGHPIYGDHFYAPAPHDSPRLMLHACDLGFVHPQNPESLDWHSPPIWDF